MAGTPQQPDLNQPDYSDLESDRELQVFLDGTYEHPADFGIPDPRAFRKLPAEVDFVTNVEGQNLTTALLSIEEHQRQRQFFQQLNSDEQDTYIVRLRIYAMANLRERASRLWHAEMDAREALAIAVHPAFAMTPDEATAGFDDLSRLRFQFLIERPDLVEVILASNTHLQPLRGQIEQHIAGWKTAGHQKTPATAPAASATGELTPLNFAARIDEIKNNARSTFIGDLFDIKNTGIPSLITQFINEKKYKGVQQELEEELTRDGGILEELWKEMTQDPDFQNETDTFRKSILEKIKDWYTGSGRKVPDIIEQHLSPPPRGGGQQQTPPGGGRQQQQQHQRTMDRDILFRQLEANQPRISFQFDPDQGVFLRTGVGSPKISRTPIPDLLLNDDDAMQDLERDVNARIAGFTFIPQGTQVRVRGEEFRRKFEVSNRNALTQQNINDILVPEIEEAFEEAAGNICEDILADQIQVMKRRLSRGGGRGGFGGGRIDVEPLQGIQPDELRYEVRNGYVYRILRVGGSSGYYDESSTGIAVSPGIQNEVQNDLLSAFAAVPRFSLVFRREGNRETVKVKMAGPSRSGAPVEIDASDDLREYQRINRGAAGTGGIAGPMREFYDRAFAQSYALLADGVVRHIITEHSREHQEAGGADRVMLPIQPIIRYSVQPDGEIIRNSGGTPTAFRRLPEGMANNPTLCGRVEDKIRQALNGANFTLVSEGGTKKIRFQGGNLSGRYELPADMISPALQNRIIARQSLTADDTDVLQFDLLPTYNALADQAANAAVDEYKTLNQQAIEEETSDRVLLPAPTIRYTIQLDGSILRDSSVGMLTLTPIGINRNIPDSLTHLPGLRGQLQDKIRLALQGSSFALVGSEGSRKIRFAGPNIGAPREFPADSIPAALQNRLFARQALTASQLDSIAADLLQVYNSLADQTVSEIIDSFETQNRGVIESQMEEVDPGQPTLISYNITPNDGTIVRAIDLPGTGRASGDLDVRIPIELARNATLLPILQARISSVMGSLRFALDGTELNVLNVQNEYRPDAYTLSDQKVISAIKNPASRNANYCAKLIGYYQGLADEVVKKIVAEFVERNKQGFSEAALPIPRVQYARRGNAIMRTTTPAPGAGAAAAPERTDIDIPEAIAAKEDRRLALDAELATLFLGSGAVVRNKAIEFANLPTVLTPPAPMPLQGKWLEYYENPRRSPLQEREWNTFIEQETQKVFDALLRDFIAHFEKRTAPTEVEKETPLEQEIQTAVNSWMAQRDRGSDRRMRAIGWVADLPGVRHIKGFFGWERAGHHSGGMMTENRLRYNRWSSIVGWGLLGAGVAASAGLLPALGGVGAAAIFGARAAFAGWTTGFFVFEKTGRMRDARLRQGTGLLAPQELGAVDKMDLSEVVGRMGAIQADCRLRINRRVDQWLRDPDDPQNTYDQALKQTYTALERQFRQEIKKNYEKELETLPLDITAAEKQVMLGRMLDQKLKEVDDRGGREAMMRVGETAVRAGIAGVIGTLIGRGALYEIGQRIFSGKVPVGPTGREMGTVGATIHNIARFLGLEQWYQNEFRQFWHGAGTRPAIPYAAGAFGTPLPPETPAIGAPANPASFPAGTPASAAIGGGAFDPRVPAGSAPVVGGGALGPREALGAAGRAVEAAAGQAAVEAAAGAGASVAERVPEFTSKHPLLFGPQGAGFHPLPDGTYATDVRSSADLQRSLRRIVMDNTKFNSFSGIDAGKVENAVANMYQLLQNKGVAGFSPLDVKGISLSNSTLHINDFDKLKYFVNHDLIGHANELVEKGTLNAQSPAVHFGSHTSDHVWQFQLDTSAENHAAQTNPDTKISVNLSDIRAGGHAGFDAATAAAEHASGQGDGKNVRDALAKAAEGVATNSGKTGNEAGTVLQHVANLLKDPSGSVVDLTDIGKHLDTYVNDITRALFTESSFQKTQEQLQNIIKLNNITVNPPLDEAALLSAFGSILDEDIVKENVREFLKGAAGHHSFTLKDENGGEHIFKVIGSGISRSKAA